MKRSADNISLASFDSLFGGREPGAAGAAREIPLEELHTFRNHPFHVTDDERMMELAQSIRERGVLVPGIVRHRKEGGYEIIAGHRRRHGCELAGLATMPAVIQELSDDEAVIVMVDSNLQRETLLPSEKAFAYRMKLEAMNHQGERSCPQVGNRTPGKKSSELLAEQTGDSKNQIYRYIRLTRLLPPLLDLVDRRKLAFVPAENLSYLTEEEQQWLLESIRRHGVFPSLAQAERLKQYSRENRLSGREVIDAILSEAKPPSKRVALKRNDMEPYFPEGTTSQQMEAVILQLLKQWKESGQPIPAIE